MLNSLNLRNNQNNPMVPQPRNHSKLVPVHTTVEITLMLLTLQKITKLLRTT